MCVVVVSLYVDMSATVIVSLFLSLVHAPLLSLSRSLLQSPSQTLTLTLHHSLSLSHTHSLTARHWRCAHSWWCRERQVGWPLIKRPMWRMLRRSSPYHQCNRVSSRGRREGGRRERGRSASDGGGRLRDRSVFVLCFVFFGKICVDNNYMKLNIIYNMLLSTLEG